MRSSGDPDITFNEHGLCSYCCFFYTDYHNRKAEETRRPWILENIRKLGRGKGYNVLIGLSGGVDSSYALHRLVEEGLRPMTFSVDNGWQTDIAQENVMRMVEGLKVPFYRYNIDIEKFHELQKAFIESGTKNIEIPSDHILMAATYKMARRYKVKTIISGGNWQTESIMPKSYGYEPKDLRFIKAIGDTKGLPTISLPQYLRYRFIKRINVVNLLDYYNYDRNEAIKILEKKFGYQAYGEKHEENEFTKWFQSWYLPIMHDIDKRRPHYSSMIQSGQMTRDEALNKLKRDWTTDKVPDTVLKKLGISGEEMARITPSSYTEYPNNEKLYQALDKIWRYFKQKKTSPPR